MANGRFCRGKSVPKGWADPNVALLVTATCSYGHRFRYSEKQTKCPKCAAARRITSLVARQAAESAEDLEGKYRALWDAVKPQPGELWEKRPCGKGVCSMGWSFGVGTRQIKDDRNSYGSPHHLVCGCLRKVSAAAGQDSSKS